MDIKKIEEFEQRLSAVRGYSSDAYQYVFPVLVELMVELKKIAK